MLERQQKNYGVAHGEKSGTLGGEIARALISVSHCMTLNDSDPRADKRGGVVQYVGRLVRGLLQLPSEWRP